ncbi:MAG: MGMT family protein, partial [Proteobacteria bacterium]|nr:MGMT family protein [Pseudomonadota bacterium]
MLILIKFQTKVYREVKKIKKGQIKTYKEIADKLNTSPRAVGQALKQNQ